MTHKRTTLLAIVSVGAFAACSGTGGTPDAASSADVAIPQNSVVASGPTAFTYADGVIVFGLVSEPQPQQVLLMAAFEPEHGACGRLQEGGVISRGDRLTVVLRGADYDQETFLPPTDGEYPIVPGWSGFAVPQLRAELSIQYWVDGVVDVQQVRASSGVVRLMNVGTDSAEMEIEATLEDGTIVSGSMELPACPDIPTGLSE